MDPIDKVRSKLQTQVPLVQHMGVELVSYSPGHVVVEAPLEPNLNTHGTAFGGSLYCVATMCGWSLVHLTLLDAGFEPSVWVTGAEVTYSKPVKGPIRAVAQIDETARAHWVECYRQNNRVRADLEVEIYNELDQRALTLNVSFAAR